MASLTDLRTKGRKTTRPWQVRYRDHTESNRSEQFTRKADAQARLLEVQTAEQTKSMDLLDGGAQPLHEIGAAFYRLNRDGWADTTAYGHRVIWNAVVLGEGEKGGTDYPRAAIADMPVRSIRKSHVLEFIADAQDAGVPVSSIRRALSLVTRSLDHAADDNLISANPAARVKPPKEDRRPRPSIITPEQMEALRAQMTDRDAALVSIMGYAGLRPHEVRALRVEQFTGTDLHLTESTADDGEIRPYLKSGHDWRAVPICKALADDVAAVDWGKKGLLLRSVHGDAWTKSDYANWRNRRFKKAVKAANAKLTEDAKKAGEDPVLIPADLNPYDLRHSIASLWYRQRIDRATIAAWMGHTVAVLDGHYAHHFKTLDALDKRTVDEMIADARKAPAG